MRSSLCGVGWENRSKTAVRWWKRLRLAALPKSYSILVSISSRNSATCLPGTLQGAKRQLTLAVVQLDPPQLHRAEVLNVRLLTLEVSQEAMMRWKID